MVYLSIGLILVFGFLIGFLLEKIHIPGFIGMIVLGVLLGPTVLNIIAPELLSISSILRQIALVVVLTRSGLNLDFRELKKVGRSAILMCFVPATFEIVAVGVASHFLLNLSWFEGFLLGCVLGAVSPAVVSPRMIKLIQGGYTKKSIPQIILAGSSADDPAPPGGCRRSGSRSAAWGSAGCERELRAPGRRTPCTRRLRKRPWRGFRRQRSCRIRNRSCSGLSLRACK